MPRMQKNAHPDIRYQRCAQVFSIAGNASDAFAQTSIRFIEYLPSLFILNQGEPVASSVTMSICFTGIQLCATVNFFSPAELT